MSELPFTAKHSFANLPEAIAIAENPIQQSCQMNPDRNSLVVIVGVEFLRCCINCPDGNTTQNLRKDRLSGKMCRFTHSFLVVLKATKAGGDLFPTLLFIFYPKFDGNPKILVGQ